MNRCVGRETSIGALQAGRNGDVLVVHGDPLENVDLLQDHARIELVLKAGRLVSGARFDAVFPS